MCVVFLLSESIDPDGMRSERSGDPRHQFDGARDYENRVHGPRRAYIINNGERTLVRKRAKIQLDQIQVLRKECVRCITMVS